MSTVQRRVVVVVAAVLAGAIAASQCGSSASWESTASAYMPSSVDGRRVDRTEAYPKALGTSLASSDVTNVATAAIGEPTVANPAPRIVLLAFGGKPSAVTSVRKRLVRGLTGKRDGSRKRAHETDISRGTFRAGDRNLSYAFAQPADGILVATIGNNRDIEAPTMTLIAMLRAGES